MAERSEHGRSHLQALRLRTCKKKARDTSAQALHDAVKASAYNQELVQRFVHELDQRQGTLFSNRQHF